MSFTNYVFKMAAENRKRPNYCMSRMAENGNRGGGGEDELDDGLWNEFENCAQGVAHLFRNSNWKNLQSAAACTTQLYKSGLDAKKRAYERGYHVGRQALSKDILALCRYSTVEVAELVALLSRYSLLPNEYVHHSLSPRRQRTAPPIPDGSSAVNLFQQALCPSATGVAAAPILTNFLQNQVYRHRKRPYSPGTSTVQGNNLSNNIPNNDTSQNYTGKRFKRQ